MAASDLAIFMVACVFCVTTRASIIHQLNDREGPIRLTDETRLHNDLFFKERRSHPAKGPVDVRFGLVLKSIVDYDAGGEAIVISAFIRQKWKNEKLSWDPKKYGGIKRINIWPKKTWLPDIYAYYDVEAQFKYNGMLDTLKTNIILSHDGSHFWLAPIVLNLGCGMNVADFPFDTQKCVLLFGSFTHDKSKLNLISEDVDLDTYSESSEWHFKSMNHTRHQTLYPGSTVEFADVRYTVIIDRKPLYYFLSVLSPTVVLAILTLLVFVQPVTGSERAVFFITLLLAMSWFVTSQVDYLPTSSEGVPLSQVFLAASLLIMMFLSICLCYSIGIHYGDLNGLEMPFVLRRYVLESLGPYLGYHLQREYPKWRTDLQLVKEAELRFYSEGQVDSPGNKNVFLQQPQSPTSMNDKFSAAMKSHESLVESLEDILGVSGIEHLSMRIDKFLGKMEDDDDSDWTRREWKMVAVILDRMFLYFFGGVFLMLMMYCLIYILYIPKG